MSTMNMTNHEITEEQSNKVITNLSATAECNGNSTPWSCWHVEIKKPRRKICASAFNNSLLRWSAWPMSKYRIPKLNTTNWQKNSRQINLFWKLPMFGRKSRPPKDPSRKNVRSQRHREREKGKQCDGFGSKWKYEYERESGIWIELECLNRNTQQEHRRFTSWFVLKMSLSTT